MPGWMDKRRGWQQAPMKTGSPRLSKELPSPPFSPHNTNLQSQFPICFQRDKISKSSSSESKNLSNLSASEESAREKVSAGSVGCTRCSAADNSSQRAAEGECHKPTCSGEENYTARTRCASSHRCDTAPVQCSSVL